MQSKDDEGNIVYGGLVTDFTDQVNAALELGATHHAVGELPGKGDILEIRGLMFEVKFTDYKRGECRIKILTDYKIAGDGTVVKIRRKDLR